MSSQDTNYVSNFFLQMGGGAADMSMSALGTHRSAMDPVELAYAKQIYIYNDDVIAGGTVPPLLLKMMEVADTLGDEVSPLAGDMQPWRYAAL